MQVKIVIEIIIKNNYLKISNQKLKKFLKKKISSFHRYNRHKIMQIKKSIIKKTVKACHKL